MLSLANVFEQLEEATVQIDKRTGTGSRLALILIDNAIEISMYNLIRSELTLDDYEEIANNTFKDKYPEFKNKTQFLLTIDKLSQSQKDIMDNCHKFRNEAYHLNLIRESIIDSTVRIYLQICCEILPGLLEFSRTILEDPFLAKYGITNSLMKFDDKIIEILENFYIPRICDPKEFSEILSLDIENRIKTLCDDLILSDKSTCLYKKTKSQLEPLLGRANRLKSISSASNALKRYIQIDKDLTLIELDIDLRGIYMDILSDIEIDKARGN